MNFKQKIKLNLFYFFLRCLLFVVFCGCKIKVENLKAFDLAVKNNRPTMLCFWHRELLFVANFFKNSSFNIYGVSSSHFDSEVLAKLLSAWKIKLIKGSSSRGWVNVLKQILHLSKNPLNVVALTNDGPTGPALIAKEGSLAAADKYGYQIIVISGKSSKQWRLSSWDKTYIPKPFSTITIKFSNIYPSYKKINSHNITDFINVNSLQNDFNS